MVRVGATSAGILAQLCSPVWSLVPSPSSLRVGNLSQPARPAGGLVVPNSPSSFSSVSLGHYHLLSQRSPSRPRPALKTGL